MICSSRRALLTPSVLMSSVRSFLSWALACSSPSSLAGVAVAEEKVIALAVIALTLATKPGLVTPVMLLR